jgi:hypothetical protein
MIDDAGQRHPVRQIVEEQIAEDHGHHDLEVMQRRQRGGGREGQRLVMHMWLTAAQKPTPNSQSHCQP